MVVSEPWSSFNGNRDVLRFEFIGNCLHDYRSDTNPVYNKHLQPARMKQILDSARHGEQATPGSTCPYARTPADITASMGPCNAMPSPAPHLLICGCDTGEGPTAMWQNLAAHRPHAIIAGDNGTGFANPAALASVRAPWLQ